MPEATGERAANAHIACFGIYYYIHHPKLSTYTGAQLGREGACGWMLSTSTEPRRVVDLST
jgi:hypothetical protein